MNHACYYVYTTPMVLPRSDRICTQGIAQCNRQYYTLRGPAAMRLLTGDADFNQDHELAVCRMVIHLTSAFDQSPSPMEKYDGVETAGHSTEEQAIGVVI